MELELSAAWRSPNRRLHGAIIHDHVTGSADDDSRSDTDHSLS
jgi:hypothetical protein